MYKKHFANQARLRRHLRVRKRLSGSTARPRLSVFRSTNQIYVQVVDDVKGTTLVSVSSRDPEYTTLAKGKLDALDGDDAPESIKGVAKNRRVRQAWVVGELVAKRAKAKGIERVVFDRGGYIYHGRVAALAEGARHGGLDF